MVPPDAAPATQVVVYEARRLIRQSISIWLSGQQGVALAGTASSIGTVAQLCEGQPVDVVLVGLTHDHERVLAEAQALSTRYRDTRLIAITDDAHEAADSALASGFHAVTNASAGAASLLRVIRAGAIARNVTTPVDAGATIGPLTPREAEVLSLVGQGNTADDISDQLGISTSTIANHKERIYNKLDVNNQAHAVAVAVATGIIAPLDGKTDGDEEIIDIDDAD